MRPYYDDGSCVIYHGDCREVLTVPGSPLADHIIADPPYDERTHAGARTAKRDADGNVDPRAHRIAIDFEPLEVIPTARMLLFAARRWVVCFCAMEMIAAYRFAAGDNWVRGGFWRRPDGAPQFTGDRPGTPGEAVAIMHAGGRKRWNGGGHHAFWEHPIVKHDRIHPTQKPESLMREMVEQFTDANETILDPFMGSGTTLVAAKRLGRKAIGIELEEKYCEIAAKRLAQGALDLFGEASA